MPTVMSYTKRTIILGLFVGLLIVPFFFVETMTGGYIPIYSIHLQAWSWFAPYRPGSVLIFKNAKPNKGPKRALFTFCYFLYLVLWLVIILLIYPSFLVGFLIFVFARTLFTWALARDNSALPEVKEKDDGSKDDSADSGDIKIDDGKKKAAETIPADFSLPPPKVTKGKHDSLTDEHHGLVLEYGVKPKIMGLALDVVKSYRSHGWQSGSHEGEDALIPPPHFENHYT